MERHQRRRHRRNKWAGKTFNSRVGGKTRKASLVFDSLYFMLVIFTVAALLRVINDLVCNKLLAQDVCHTGIMVIILYIFPFQSDEGSVALICIWRRIFLQAIRGGR